MLRRTGCCCFHYPFSCHTNCSPYFPPKPDIDDFGCLSENSVPLPHPHSCSRGEEIAAILFLQKTEANIDPNQDPFCLY